MRLKEKLEGSDSKMMTNRKQQSLNLENRLKPGENLEIVLLGPLPHPYWLL